MKKFICILFLSFLFFFFWPCTVACGILVPQPGIEPSSPAVEAQSLNHWCAREVPISFSFFLDFAYKRCHISASVLNPWFLWSPKGIGKFFLLSGWNILEHFKRGFVGSEFITRMGMWGSLAPSWLEEALPVLASGKGGLGLEGGRVEVQRSLCLRPSRVCLPRQAHPHLPCCLSLEGGGWKSGRPPVSLPRALTRLSPSPGTSSFALPPTWAACASPTSMLRPRSLSKAPSSSSGPASGGPSSASPTCPFCAPTRNPRWRSRDGKAVTGLSAP